MMFAMRSSSHGTPSPFIIVRFTNEPDLIRVAAQLRRAWMTKPDLPNLPFYPSSPAEFERFETLFKDVLKNAGNCTSDRAWIVSTNVDANPGAIDTFWRKKISYSYNHIFADTWRFIFRQWSDVGGFVPPCDSLFQVHTRWTEQQPLETEFESNILVMAAYIAPGVSLTWKMDEGFEGVFNGTNTAEVWWIQSRKKVRIFVEKEGPDTGADKVAAVLCIGRLGPRRDCEGQTQAGSERDQALNQGSVDCVSSQSNEKGKENVGKDGAHSSWLGTFPW